MGIFLFSLKKDETDFINIGWGTDISIKELADLIARLTYFDGHISWDTTKPDGMLKKCLDVYKMKAYGFVPKISLETGVMEMIKIYKELKYKTTRI